MISQLKKVKIIFNPQSGLGFKWPFFKQLALGLPRNSIQSTVENRSLLEQLEQELLAIGIHTETTIATSAQAATATALACSKAQYDLVIAAGGDGTINAVINGLANTSTPLAIVPVGSINLLSLQLNLPTTLQAACQRIKNGQLIKIDLGLLNQHYFASLAGIGFDAFVIKHITPEDKRRFGVLAYATAALSNMFTYKFRTINFRLDNTPKVYTGYMLIVGNVKYYGGKMILQPNATINDGKLDLCVIQKKDFLSFLNYSWRLRRGELDRYLDISFYKCDQLEIIQEKQHIQLDGDYIGQLSNVTIKIVPQALNVLV